MTDTIKTAAAYIRVSDERQDEYSPSSQSKKIREYAKANGYILPDEYVFYDDGISGRTAEKRDQFRNLIGLAKEKDHPIDVILVWKFSRFARNQEQSIVYKSALHKIGVDVISVSEPLPEGPFGSLIERIIEWMDEYYSINLAVEVRRGMTEKVMRGEPICAPATGYDIIDKHYVPNDDADLVRDVFRMYLDGVGLRAIATYLSSRGFRTRFGNLPDNRFVEYMLNNPVYIGKIRFSTEGRAASRRKYDDPNMIITDGVHDPIIDADTWERTQALLAENKKRYARFARREAAPSEYSLRSIFRCSCCGATLVRICTKCPSLQCHNYARGSCKRSHSISVSKAEKALSDALLSIIDSRDFRVDHDAYKSAEPRDADRIRTQIAAEERKLQRARDAFQAGIDTMEEYAETKRRITAAIEQLEQQLNVTAPPTRSDEEYIAMIEGALTLLNDENADPGLVNSALLEIVDKVIYHADTKSIDVFLRP